MRPASGRVGAILSSHASAQGRYGRVRSEKKPLESRQRGEGVYDGAGTHWCAPG